MRLFAIWDVIKTSNIAQFALQHWLRGGGSVVRWMVGTWGGSTAFHGRISIISSFSIPGYEPGTTRATNGCGYHWAISADNTVTNMTTEFHQFLVFVLCILSLWLWRSFMSVCQYFFIFSAFGRGTRSNQVFKLVVLFFYSTFSYWIIIYDNFLFFRHATTTIFTTIEINNWQFFLLYLLFLLMVDERRRFVHLLVISYISTTKKPLQPILYRNIFVFVFLCVYNQSKICPVEVNIIFFLISENL